MSPPTACSLSRRGEAVGRSVLDMMPDASRDAIAPRARADARAPATSRGSSPPSVTPPAAGPTVRSSRSTSAFRARSSNSQPHLTIVIRDITDWKRAEEGSEWQRRVLEAVATGIDLREVLAHDRAFPRDAVPGRRMRHPSHRRRRRDAALRLRAVDAARIRRSDGRNRHRSARPRRRARRSIVASR